MPTPLYPSGIPGLSLIPGSLATPGGSGPTPPAGAYPNTIQQGAGSSLGQSGTIGSFGFEHGGNQYWFLVEDNIPPPHGDRKVHAWKSTDQGRTWNRQDDTNAPTPTFGVNMGTAYTCGQDGSKVWVLWSIQDVAAVFPAPNWPGLGIGAAVFDCSTDTWGSTINYSSPAPYPVFTGAHPPNSTSNPAYMNIAMAVRGPSDYEVTYSGLYELDGSGNALGRVWKAKFDGSTFGAAAMVNGQSGSGSCFRLVAAVGDSLGAHIFYDSNTSPNPSSGGTLYHVCVDSAGTQSVATVVDADLFFGLVAGNVGNFSESRAVSFSVSGTSYLGIAVYDVGAAGAQSINFWYATSSTTPTWTGPIPVIGSSNVFEQLDPSTRGFSYPAMFSLGVSGGMLAVSWTAVYNFLGSGAYGVINTYGYATATFPPSSFSAIASFSPDFGFDPSLTPAQITSFGGAAGVYLCAMCLTGSGLEQEQAQSFLVPGQGALSNRLYIPGVALYLSTGGTANVG